MASSFVRLTVSALEDDTPAEQALASPQLKRRSVPVRCFDKPQKANKLRTTIGSGERRTARWRESRPAGRVEGRLANRIPS
jgi:hypothetical protein